MCVYLEYRNNTKTFCIECKRDSQEYKKWITSFCAPFNYSIITLQNVSFCFSFNSHNLAQFFFLLEIQWISCLKIFLNIKPQMFLFSCIFFFYTETQMNVECIEYILLECVEWSILLMVLVFLLLFTNNAKKFKPPFMKMDIWNFYSKKIFLIKSKNLIKNKEKLSNFKILPLLVVNLNLKFLSRSICYIKKNKKRSICI